MERMWYTRYPSWIPSAPSEAQTVELDLALEKVEENRSTAAQSLSEEKRLLAQKPDLQHHGIPESGDPGHDTAHGEKATRNPANILNSGSGDGRTHAIATGSDLPSRDVCSAVATTRGSNVWPECRAGSGSVERP